MDDLGLCLGGCGELLGNLQLGGPEGLHHLVGGVRAAGVPLAADDLALGGEAELSGEVVLGLGAAGVHVLVGLAATANENKIIIP